MPTRMDWDMNANNDISTTTTASFGELMGLVNQLIDWIKQNINKVLNIFHTFEEKSEEIINEYETRTGEKLSSKKKDAIRKRTACDITNEIANCCFKRVNHLCIFGKSIISQFITRFINMEREERSNILTCIGTILVGIVFAIWWRS